RSSTCSRWPPGWTPWSSARARSSARCGRGAAGGAGGGPAARRPPGSGRAPRAPPHRGAPRPGAPARAGGPGAGRGGARRGGGGEAPDRVRPLAGLHVLVVGAGSMSALAVATAHRLGAVGIVVTNRTPERAERLAASVSGSTAGFADLPAAVAVADVVISCTG